MLSGPEGPSQGPAQPHLQPNPLQPAQEQQQQQQVALAPLHPQQQPLQELPLLDLTEGPSEEDPGAPLLFPMLLRPQAGPGGPQPRVGQAPLLPASTTGQIGQVPLPQQHFQHHQPQPQAQTQIQPQAPQPHARRERSHAVFLPQGLPAEVLQQLQASAPVTAAETAPPLQGLYEANGGSGPSTAWLPPALMPSGQSQAQQQGRPLPLQPIQLHQVPQPGQSSVKDRGAKVKEVIAGLPGVDPDNPVVKDMLSWLGVA